MTVTVTQEVTMNVYTAECDECGWTRVSPDYTTAHDLRAEHERGHKKVLGELRSTITKAKENMK